MAINGPYYKSNSKKQKEYSDNSIVVVFRVIFLSRDTNGNINTDEMGTKRQNQRGKVSQLISLISASQTLVSRKS